MPIKIKPTEKSEQEKEIERLEEQVRHAEEHGGMTDTAHHEMLRRAKGEPARTPTAGDSLSESSEAKEETKELTDGKYNL
jgi:hypothetical protein